MRGIVVALITTSAITVGCGDGRKPDTHATDTIRTKFQTAPGLITLAGQEHSLYVYMDRGYPSRPHVRLQADPYPFGEFSDIAEKTVRLGDAEFRVAPRVNTRYRAIVTDGEASGTAGPVTQKVFLEPRVRVALTNGRPKLFATLKVPPTARANLGPVYFYAGSGKGSRFVRIGVAPRYLATKSRLAAALTARVTPARVFACTRNGWLRGTEPWGSELHCGAASVRVP
jgi:hypothetical protein